MPDVGLVLILELSSRLQPLSAVRWPPRDSAVELLSVLVLGRGMKAVFIDVPGRAVVAIRSNSTSSLTEIDKI